MFTKLVYLAFVALVIAAAGSPCPATIAPVTRVTTGNPNGTIPYNLLSITVGSYTVAADRLVVGTTTVELTGTGAPWAQMDNLDIHDAINTGLGTTATTMLFGGKIWKDNNGDNPDFFLFESGCDAADTPAVAAILSGGQLGQSVTIPGQWVSLGYSRITNAPDGMGMAGQNIGGMSWAITDLRDSTGKPLTNSSVIEGIALTARNGADLTCFCAVLSGQILTATHPDPADGAIYKETWATLGWTPGDTAASHDIYVGENFDDVNSGAAGTFRVNQPAPSALFFIGLGMPGDPYPDGLVPGTTYYWRIDEVEANGTTKHKGSVWSFTIPSKKAHNPTPPDGAKFMPTDVKLAWTPGLGAKLHYVNFGDNLDTVSNAAAGTPVGVAAFTPTGPLQLNKTYYWRVDEFDAAATHKGDVWSFTTTIPGLGSAIAERWNNINGTALSALKSDPRYPNNPDVVETVTQFAWDGTDTDNYGGRIEAWLYIPATGDYTFWLNTDDNGELWLSTDEDSSNIRLIARETGYTDLNVWNAGEEQSPPIRLTGGEKYYIMALWKEGGGGDHCQVAWQGPTVPARVVIPGANLSPYEPVSANSANPSNGATGVKQAPSLKWKAGLQAASHEVYFGTTADAVKNATKASPEFKGTRAIGAESYSPGTLAWETTYYWRIDEVNNTNPKSPWVGRVWSFTTANFAVIDDFEGYTDNDKANEAIWQTWVDGFGTTTNGAVVGNSLPPYAEQTIVHGGRQSMPLAYDNLTSARNSEASVVLTYPRDWTAEGVTALSLWYYGNSANSSERMYVSIANRTGAPAIVYNDAANATTMEVWMRWVVPIQAFGQGINLRDVDKIAIGFGTKGSTAPGGTGKMYIDDIGLYRSASKPEVILLEAEAANPLGASWRLYTDPASSGGRHIGSQDGDGDDNTNPPAASWLANYTFTVTGGVYRIAARIITSPGNSFWIRIPGATSPQITRADGWVNTNPMVMGDAWHWDEFHNDDQNDNVVYFTLSPGQHTLELAKREDGISLDAMVIIGE